MKEIIILIVVCVAVYWVGVAILAFREIAKIRKMEDPTRRKFRGIL